MSKSIFFNDEDIRENPDYRMAVESSAFLQKIEDICTYEQDYTYAQVVDLEKAEYALIMLRALFK